MELKELKNKRILIVGLAQTGVSLAHFLSKYGAQVTINDQKVGGRAGSLLRAGGGFTS